MACVPCYDHYVVDLVDHEGGDPVEKRLWEAEKTLQCPYCGGAVVRYVDSNVYWANDSMAGSVPLADSRKPDGCQAGEYLAVCNYCGFWFGRGSRMDGPMMARWAFGLLRSYEIDSLDVPLRELIIHLHRKHNQLIAINPFKAEDLVGQLLADTTGQDVQRIGGRKDGGVDLLLKADGKPRAIVQVKWRQHVQRAESVKVIRELCGTLLARGIPQGILVTTRKYLSPPGLSEIDAIKASPVAPGIFTIKTMHYDEILSMLDLSAAKLGGFTSPPLSVIDSYKPTLEDESPELIFRYRGTFDYKGNTLQTSQKRPSLTQRKKIKEILGEDRELDDEEDD
jgi:hypothetical protein